MAVNLKIVCQNLLTKRRSFWKASTEVSRAHHHVATATPRHVTSASPNQTTVMRWQHKKAEARQEVGINVVHYTQEVVSNKANEAMLQEQNTTGSSGKLHL